MATASTWRKVWTCELINVDPSGLRKDVAESEESVEKGSRSWVWGLSAPKLLANLPSMISRMCTHLTEVCTTACYP